jgi:hypothetical protein
MLKILKNILDKLLHPPSGPDAGLSLSSRWIASKGGTPLSNAATT